MLQSGNTIIDVPFEGLSVTKIVSRDQCETLLITLEKDSDFPEHTSPRDALLVMLEGMIIFTISGKDYPLKKHQIFQFPALEKHSVLAKENSKFLIVR